MQLKLTQILSCLAATGVLLLGAGTQAAAADDKVAAVAPDSAARPAFGLQTPIEQLMDDPGAREAIENVLPSIAAHRRYDEFKSMSFEELQPMAPNLLTPEKLSRIAEGLAQLAKPKKQN